MKAAPASMTIGVMAKPAVRRALSPGDTVVAMSARFRVSQEAIQRRLCSFRLVEGRLGERCDGAVL